MFINKENLKKVKGTEERYYCLPIEGKKVIGRMTRPGKDDAKKLSKKEAKIIDDKKMPIILSFNKNRTDKR